MNHTVVAAATCVSCHETGMAWFGVSIKTRPANHNVGVDCKGCHTTSSFSGATGGKPANHIPTSQACTLCHANGNLGPNPGVMNHSGITSGCTTCHAASPTGIAFTGVTPKPQGTGHIPTTADCATCHKSTTAFGPGTLMEHTGHQQRLRHLPRHRQELHRSVESQDQAGQPHADHGELRELPRSQATSRASPARR